MEPKSKKPRVVRSPTKADASSFDLKDIYRKCCALTNNNDSNISGTGKHVGKDILLNRLEESGAMELYLWPLLKQKSKEANEGGSVVNIQVVAESDTYKAALIVLKLINVRTYKLSKSEMNGPLSFMRQKGETADTGDSDGGVTFRLFLQTILSLPKEYHRDIVQFLITAYSNMTRDMYPILREPLLELVGIGMWDDMPPRYRDLQLRRSVDLRATWGEYKSKSPKEKNDNSLHVFLPKVVREFLNIIECQRKNDDEDDDVEDRDNDGDTNMSSEQDKKISATASAPQMKFAHTTLQFLVDLLSNTSTRRYLRPYLISIHLSTKCKLSDYYHGKHQSNNISRGGSTNLFQQLTQILQQLETFAIDDATSSPLSYADMASMYHERAHVLQKLCHRHHPDTMSELIYAGVGMICKDERFLRRNLDRVVDVHVLIDLCHRLRLLDRESCSSTAGEKRTRRFVTEILVYHHSLGPSEAKVLSSLPLYPDEKLMWNPNLVPAGNKKFGMNQDNDDDDGSAALALPKMSMQFLTYSDYLLRCFKLLRLESAYEIRSDIVDAVRRMRPSLRHGYNDGIDDFDVDEMWSKRRSLTEFHGWSRMGLELKDEEGYVCPVRLLKVSPPRLGENVPSEVLAEVTVDLKHCGGSIRKEWDSIGEFDNLFLIGVDATMMQGGPVPSLESDRRITDDEDMTFPKRFGVIGVRGCMVLEVRDDDGNVLSDPSYIHEGNAGVEEKKRNNKKREKSYKRYLKVALDPAQYAADATGSGSHLGTNIYKALNIIVRRHGKENNFKAVLETVRGLMQGAASINKSVPTWLQPVLLGYGDPASASFSSDSMIKFARDTAGVSPPDAALDYGDTFLSEEHLRESFQGKVIVDGREESSSSDEGGRLQYRIQSVDKEGVNVMKAISYPFSPETNGNPVRFTPVQVKAIRSGLSPGLTMIVGPPGTGKTDVAVQIIANLYHSFPTQRTVLITHSNAALNDLFEKVMARGDIDERYMLRLGSGERDLQTTTEFDFTKTGRVNHILARRATLLEEVQLMSESLGISGAAERGPDGAPSYTSETAEYFNLHHIQKRIHIFDSKIKGGKGDVKVGDVFPFCTYFKLSESDRASLTLQDALAKFKKLKECFDELAEYRPLELLRSQRQRTDYLLTKQVRIIAMTCTHAAIARSHLVELGFQYDNIVMEEAAQMLDVETFVPLLLQQGSIDFSSRLKRICLIGDHHQLPPVIKNETFSKFSNLDQSLFTRLIRLGVPSIELDKQGRTRIEIAKLYNWRYQGLGNLQHVSTEKRFLTANPGLVHTFQMINVEDYEGRGEYAPTPFYYQNTGEAEYAVALFQYMVLMGYPPEKISILTTYNGQKSLIEDILSQRCSEGTPLAGFRPGAVSTVDKYQGQQNDYIILSLVRSKSVGHIRDIRRLVVAVSRARLGLYVLGRQKLFSSCHELHPVMDQFAERPNVLELFRGEEYPSQRSLIHDVEKEKKFTVSDVTILGKIVHDMQQQMVKPESNE